ncbi:uncharacterized protein [Antedon mediterranea]|uniref:uncharacterized protein n=1 Tax=Antedon mediterranea TaxID=105859 RepID=UPI003AF7BC24
MVIYIEIDISEYFGNEIRETGTLFVALLSSDPTVIEIPVIHFRVYFEKEVESMILEKNLSDIFSVVQNEPQDVWLSFLPDGDTEHILLPSFSCFIEESSCFTMTTRLFIPHCDDLDSKCLDIYAEWVQATDDSRDYNCGIASIDTVVEPLFDQCLVAPIITSVSGSMSISLEESVTLYCVASGVPSATVQWATVTDSGEYVPVTAPSTAQSVYEIMDFSETTYVCQVGNIADTEQSENVIISVEDGSCTNYYAATRSFFQSMPECYNMTMTFIPPTSQRGGSLYINNFVQGSVLYSVSFPSSNIVIGRGLEFGEGSFSSRVTVYEDVITSIEITILNLNTGVTIYAETFDGIIITPEPDIFQIDLTFDQPIKINSTSTYEIELSIRSEPDVGLSNEAISVNGFTCEKSSPECLQFLSDWNRLVLDQVGAGCSRTDVEFPSLKLCFGEFFEDPEVVRHPESQAAEVGMAAILECNIENVEFYEWFKNGGRIASGADGPVYNVQLDQGQNQGDYSCFGYRSQDRKDAKSNSATVLISGLATFRALARFNIPFEDDYADRESLAFKNFTDALEATLSASLPQSFEFFVTSLESGSVIANMDLYFNQAQNATTYSSMINDSLTTLEGYETDPESVVVTSISSCVGEDIVIDGTLYTFEDAPLGVTADSLQDCPLYSDQGKTVSLATRYCGGDFVSGALWESIVITDCYIGTTSMQIQMIDEIEVTEENGGDVAEALAEVTSNTEDLDEEAVDTIADILEDIVDLEMPDEMITLNVVEVVDNIIDSNILDSSMRETASSFVTSLERQLATVAAAGMNFTSVQPHVGVVTLAVSPESLVNGLAYVAFSDGDSLKDAFEPDDVKTYYEKTFPFEMVGASIALPPEIVSLSQEQTGEDEIRVYFTVYQNSSLFISNSLGNASGEGFTRQVGSQIISATIEAVKIDGLLTPIKAAFLPRFETANNTECVFWDFSLDNGIGDWSSEGCELDGTTDDRVVCLCDHLTNFAILVDYYEPKDSAFHDALTIISLIGCIVSIVCLAVTIATYLYFKQFRSKRPQKILINLSLSLLLLYLVFAIGIEQTGSRNGCIAVAALIHYFGLASIFWMSIEAVNMYLMFVKVFYDDIEHFMLKVCLAGYGFPLVIVAVCLGVDVDHYANENYCFIPSGNVRNYGFILIIGILLLFNVVVFILVMRTLTCGRKIAKTVDQTKREIVMKRLQNAIAVSVLLGLTWVFGFLAIDADSTSRDAFQLLFCIFNSLQGLFIFLLFCVRQKDIRDAWKTCCKESDRAKRAKYATDTSNSKGKVKDQSIPLTGDSTHSTNTASKNIENV